MSVTIEGKEPITWAMELNIPQARREDLIQALLILREQKEAYDAYCRHITEALNTGDGTYRP